MPPNGRCWTATASPATTSACRRQGLELDTADVTDVAADPALWEKVVRKLRAGAMPPAPRPRPDEATYARFIARLETELDAVAAADPNPGRTEAFHRLNRAEYRNVVRDLLALDVDVAELLPADDGSYGFDNIAGVLGVSPTLLERYLSAAKKVSRLAVGSPDMPPTALTWHLAADYPQDDRIEGLPFGTRGGIAIPFNFPLDAEYVIRLRLGRDTLDSLAAFEVPHELDVSLDGEHLRTFHVGEPPPAKAPIARATSTARGATASATPTPTGCCGSPCTPDLARLRAAFRKKTSAYPETLRQPYLRPYTNTTGGDTRYQPYLSSVVVTGPYEASGGAAGRGDPEPGAHLHLPAGTGRRRRRARVRRRDYVDAGPARLPASGQSSATSTCSSASTTRGAPKAASRRASSWPCGGCW